VRNSFLNGLRWIAFIPGAFLAAVIAGYLGTLVGSWTSEFIGFVTSGGFSAFGFVIGGLTIAPAKSKKVKWLLIVLAAVLGALSAYGSWHGDDKLKVATGLAMMLVALSLGSMPLTDVQRSHLDTSAHVSGNADNES
jgi:hypothetical protein